MIFIYADGHEEEKRIGSAIRGLHRKGLRPIDCKISILELMDYARQVGQEQAMHYCNAIVYRALSPEILSSRRGYES